MPDTIVEVAGVRHVAVLSVHGIGEHGEGWSDLLRLGVEREVARRYPGGTLAVTWREVCWGEIIARRMRRIQAALRGRQVPTYVRRWMDDFMPDAVSYREAYDEIHDLMHAAHDAARQEVRRRAHRQAVEAGAVPDVAREAGEDAEALAPVVVVGHSWGSVIAADWVYDRRSSGVAGLVTLGSPIRWLVAKLPPDAIDPARPPLWLNVHDAFDPVASPLRPLSAEYARAVTEDREVRNGTFLDRLRPIGGVRRHHNYASTPAVHAAIVDVVAAAAAFALPPSPNA